MPFPMKKSKAMASSLAKGEMKKAPAKGKKKSGKSRLAAALASGGY